MDTSSLEQRPLRSPAIEAAGTLFVGIFFLGATYMVGEALFTGRTKFPAKFNDLYVTWSTNPGWYAASVIAWLFIWALMAHTTWRCWKRVVQALRASATNERRHWVDCD